MTFIYVGAYVVVGVFVGRRIAGFLQKEFMDIDPSVPLDADDLFGLTIFAIIAAIAWPFVMAVFALRHVMVPERHG